MTTVWRGYITFALISVPVRLFRAARQERVKLKQLYRVPPPPGPVLAPSGVSRQARAVDVEETVAPLRQFDDEVIPNTALVKGFEYEKGRYVTVESEDLKSAAAKTSTEMQIQEFVKLDEIDPLYFETSYFVHPEEAGEKTYALLYESLKETDLVAIAQFAMHRREHVVAIRAGRSGIIAHTLYFASEVRADQEYVADTSDLSSKELTLAKTLIKNLEEKFDPQKYRDTYREKIEAVIAAKLAGKETVKTVDVHRPAPSADVMEALRKSLELIKKPAKAAEARPKQRIRQR